jgi:hypothetical protein
MQNLFAFDRFPNAKYFGFRQPGSKSFALDNLKRKIFCISSKILCISTQLIKIPWILLVSPVVGSCSTPAVSPHPSPDRPHSSFYWQDLFLSHVARCACLLAILLPDHDDKIESIIRKFDRSCVGEMCWRWRAIADSLTWRGVRTNKHSSGQAAFRQRQAASGSIAQHQAASVTIGKGIKGHRWPTVDNLSWFAVIEFAVCDPITCCLCCPRSWTRDPPTCLSFAYVSRDHSHNGSSRTCTCCLVYKHHPLGPSLSKLL